MSTLKKTGKRVTWDKFCDKFNNCILNNFRHAENVVFIVTDMEDLTINFEAIYMSEDST